MNEELNEKIRKIAEKMWRVHPKDLDVMGFKNRIDFYENELRNLAKNIIEEAANLVEGFELTQEVAEDNYVDYEASQVILDHFSLSLANTWICPKCGVDRLKENCPKGNTAALNDGCPMVGVAQ